jgi:hypothetical protein
MNPHLRGFFRRQLRLRPWAAGTVGAILLFLLIAAAGFWSGRLRFEPALRISDQNGRFLARLPLSDGRFIHHYRHTIHLSPVDEYFRIERGTLRLYELRYDTTSVGMPSDSELGFRIEGNRFVLKMDRTFKSIPLRVSVEPEHALIAGGIYYPLRNWADPMKGLVLTADTLLIIVPKED